MGFSAAGKWRRLCRMVSLDNQVRIEHHLHMPLRFRFLRKENPTGLEQSPLLWRTAGGTVAGDLTRNNEKSFPPASELCFLEHHLVALSSSS